MSIYVETCIRAPIERVWAYTQTPALHERWDLRFSKIHYLPRIDDSAPQRFRYTTRIGCVVEIRGEGETTGQRTLPDGGAASALKFASGAPLSLIREDSGYWKYIPTRDGVRFLTRYDYRTRFGAAGVAFDRLVFRPLIGWATAWSFDRLRLWLEERVDPGVAVRCTFIHVVTRLALIAVVVYEGLVVARSAPVGLETTFELFALNLSAAALALADRLVIAGVPSARRCVRRPPEQP